MAKTPFSRRKDAPASLRRRLLTGARVTATTALSVALMAGAGASAAHANAATGFQPFAPGSPFRAPIPAAATVDPNSGAMVARMSANNALYSNLIEFSIPIYNATASTPRYTVSCTMNWGPCPFNGIRVPIPADAKPSPGSDGAMVVVDPSTGQAFEFWQARRAGSGWTTSWGGISSLAGDGWTMRGNSTGSGASRLGGVILTSEIERGVIPHALALQSNNVCANVFRPPAIKTDGRSTRSDCIPEGARVRLDPAVDLDSLDLTPAARAVAQAMQTYGGYVVDVGGAPLSVSFERDTTASDSSIGRAYADAGLRWDYDGLPGVPWNRLQVLAQSSNSTPPSPTANPTGSPQGGTPTRDSVDRTPETAQPTQKKPRRDRRDSYRRARWSN